MLRITEACAEGLLVAALGTDKYSVMPAHKTQFWSLLLCGDSMKQFFRAYTAGREVVDQEEGASDGRERSEEASKRRKTKPSTGGCGRWRALLQSLARHGGARRAPSRNFGKPQRTTWRQRRAGRQPSQTSSGLTEPSIGLCPLAGLSGRPRARGGIFRERRASSPSRTPTSSHLPQFKGRGTAWGVVQVRGAGQREGRVGARGALARGARCTPCRGGGGVPWRPSRGADSQLPSRSRWRAGPSCTPTWHSQSELL